MSKRYYWLKLKDDFFDGKVIKKLRRVAGGDTYVLIYLKMLLRAMKNEGYITYTGLENSFAEELALDLDEDAENVAITLQYLARTELVETSDNINYFLPSAAESVGSETASTIRSRECRSKQKMLQCNKNATQNVALQQDCNASATQVQQNCSVEKEKREDTREDKREKNTEASPLDEFTDEVQEAIKAFAEMRKTKIKKPMTDNAVKRLAARLKTLSDDPEEQVKILNQSEDACWLDIYALKDKGGISSNGHRYECTMQFPDER